MLTHQITEDDDFHHLALSAFQAARVRSQMRTMAMPSLDDVAQEAAAGDEIKRYLAVRGIKTTATLALLATNLEQLDRVLVKPLMDGWPIEGSNPITLTPSEQPIATAILHHMWSECRSLWSKMQAAATPASFPTAIHHLHRMPVDRQHLQQKRKLRSSSHMEYGTSSFTTMSGSKSMAATGPSLCRKSWGQS